MYDVFISYIHEDEEAARGLYDFLRAKLKEITVRTAPNIFLSSERLQLGDNWPQTIQEALKSATVVLAIFSVESVNRPWVNFEAGGAWFAEGKTLIPLCIGKLRPEHLPKPYSDICGINLGDVSSLLYLVKRLVDVFKWPGLPPPFFQEKDEDVKRLMKAISLWEKANETSN